MVRGARRKTRRVGALVLGLAALLAACTSLLGIEEIEYFEPDAGRSTTPRDAGDEEDDEVPVDPEEPPPAPTEPPPAPTGTCRPRGGGPCNTHFICCDAGRCVENNTCQDRCLPSDAGCNSDTKNECCIGFVCRFDGIATRCIRP